MPEKIIRIVKGDGPVEVEISIGQAQWGAYDFHLWNSDGLSPQLVGSGLNVDQVPDIFKIEQPIENLNGTLLGWAVSIIAYSDSPGQRYSAAVQIRQKGVVVQGGDVPPAEGALDGAIVFRDFVRFLVV